MSLNRASVKPEGVAGAGSWDHEVELQIYNKLQVLYRRTDQESQAEVGNSPVSEMYVLLACHPK